MAKSAQADGNAFMDPCGDRLQDLCEPLILYFHINHHGPARIEELQKFADAGQVLKLTCPVSGKPYQCSAGGLSAPGQAMRIYIYDAEPVHRGSRWCVYSKPGVTSGATEAFFAEKIPEEKFRQFQPYTDPLQFR